MMRTRENGQRAGSLARSEPHGGLAGSHRHRDRGRRAARRPTRRRGTSCAAGRRIPRRTSRWPTSCATRACSRKPVASATRLSRWTRGTRIPVLLARLRCSSATRPGAGIPPARRRARDWARVREGNILLREGKTDAAARCFRQRRRFPDSPTLLARSGTQAERDRIAADLEAAARSADRDPENKLHLGRISRLAGYRARRLRLLRKAVEGNYLCVPGHGHGPPLRLDPQGPRVRRDPRRGHPAAEGVRGRGERPRP